MIVVGASCENSAASCIYGSNACFNLQKGTAIVKLVKYSTGYYTLLINGYDADDTRMAAKVFVNKLNQFNGYEFIITGSYANWQNAIIIKIK